MTQILRKKPKIIIVIEEKKQKEKVKKKFWKKKTDKSNGISNPRYFENARTPKKAIDTRPLNTSMDLYGNKF
ncbi:MAG: hypothetical protein ACXAEX_19390 [Promethearchaeota archaeon]|jgi:hypothetical protein